MNTLEPVLEKVGRILTDQYGINIVCEGNRCCTDGRTIYLPALPDDVPEDLWRSIRGFIDHEGAHLIFNSNFRIGNEFRRKHGDQGFGLLNILEDARVENAMKQRFPGSIANLEHAYQAAEQNALGKANAGEPIPFMRQLAFAALARAQQRPVPTFVDPAITALAARIDNEIQGSVHAPDTKTVAALAESAWATVSAYLQSQAPAVDPARGDTEHGDSNKVNHGHVSQNQSDTNSGGNNASSTSDATAPSNPGTGTGRKRKEKKSGGNNAPATSPATGNGEGNSKGVSVPDVSGRADDAEGGIIGSLGSDLAAALQRHAETTGAYRVWTTQHDTVTVVADCPGRSHAHRLAPVMRHVAGVRQKLLQTLQAEVRTRWQVDTDDGALNPRALHRLAAACYSAEDPEVTASLTRRVFRRKVVTKRLKTAVLLLIDASHSMSNKKIELAKDTALVLCEALDRLGLPTAVWSFSTAGTHGHWLREVAKATGIPAETLEAQYRFAPLQHERFKDFGESFRRVSGRFDQLRTHMMTPLGESLLFAARELARRPEPRKVILCLTDGRPTVGVGNDVATYNHAHETIRRVERAGIDVALVGILERCVLDLHHRAVVVEQLDDLPRNVMGQLQTLLSRDTRTVYRDTRRIGVSASA